MNPDKINMHDVKLITKAPEFVRSEEWAIVRDYFVSKSKFPEDVVQDFCDSVGCLTVNDVRSEKTREVVDCYQGMLALEGNQIPGSEPNLKFHWLHLLKSGGLGCLLPCLWQSLYSTAHQKYVNITNALLTNLQCTKMVHMFLPVFRIGLCYS